MAPLTRIDLVMGGAGFIGSHLVDRLLAKGRRVPALTASGRPAGMRIKGMCCPAFPLGLLAIAFAITLSWGLYNPLRGIQVVAATFGANCKAPLGNITGAIGKICDGRGDCAFQVNPLVVGFDPAPQCEKDLKISYVCSLTHGERTLESVPGVGVHPDIYKISCVGR